MDKPHVEIEDPVTITIYGGRKETVLASFDDTMGDREQHAFHTWINVRAMKRLLFLFDGGIESAGGIFEIVCVIALMGIVIAFFAFWQVVIYFLVMVVLALFTGGAALKYIRGTFIEVEPAKLNPSLLEEFVKRQLVDGNFIFVDNKENALDLEPITRSSNTATRAFDAGIKLSLIVGTLFFVAQIGWRLINGVWLSDITMITIIGLAFLISIIITDIGVIMRYRLDNRISKSEN